jgi:hypothetical protein
VINQNETLLNKLYVNCDNYIDEKENVMNCREVLDAILAPLCAKLFIQNNQIYIIDVNNLAKENITYKRYINTTNLIYDSTITVNNLNDIDLLIGSNSVNYSDGINKLDVKFNKYVYDDIDLGVNENTISLPINNGNGTIIDNKYNLKMYAINKNYEHIQGDIFYYRLVTLDNSEPTEYYVSSNGESKYQINTGINVISGKSYLKLKGKFMVAQNSLFNVPQNPTVVNNYAGSWAFGAPYFYSVQFPYFKIKITVGDYIYMKNGWVLKSSLSHLLPINHYIDVYWMRELYTPIKINQWLDFDEAIICNWGEKPSVNIDTPYIPFNNDNNVDSGSSINSIVGGELKIEIYTLDIWHSTDYTYRFKDFGFVYAKKDENGNYVDIQNTDLEIQGTVSDEYINSKSIVLLHGSDEHNNSRGSLLIKKNGLYYDSDFATNERLININQLNREGQTGTIEELLINTYLSNKMIPRYELNCNIQGYFNQFNLFKYSLLKRDEMEVKMIPISIESDYVNYVSSLKMMEIVEDELVKIDI